MPLLGTQNRDNMGAIGPESGEVLVLQTSNLTALFRAIYDEGRRAFRHARIQLRSVTAI